MYNDHSSTISHPDLHLDSIFVDLETNKIISITDWQRVSVSPPLLQRPFPQMLEVSGDEAGQRTKVEKRL